MTLTWATTNDVRLQKATDLVNPVWQDVPESEGTNTVSLSMTEGKAFFRLVRGPKPIQPSSGMVAWWSGDGNALDLVGTNHGTLMNGTTFAEGMVGQAFSIFLCWFDRRSLHLQPSPGCRRDQGHLRRRQRRQGQATLTSQRSREVVYCRTAGQAGHGPQ